MILGYSIIVIPTGIVVGSTLPGLKPDGNSALTCKKCGKSGHASEAAYCRHCDSPISAE